MAQGIDVRQTSGRLQFRALLLDSAGAVVNSGTTNLRLYELQDGGTLFSYDWNDNTFKSGALTTENQAMTHRQGNNNTTDTGIWTFDETDLGDFVVGGVYFAWITNAGASPPVQVREFQFGNAQGDLTVTSSLLNVNIEAIDTGTNEAARLEAALTTSNGIDINLEQALDTTPTVDTTGDALLNAARSLPNDVVPGAALGLARVTDLSSGGSGSLRLVDTIMQAGSTTSLLIADAADLPASDTDDIYNTLTIVAYDVSAGNKPNIRYVSDYNAATNTFTLDEILDFTPEIGVDTFEVWAIAASAVSGAFLTELEKVTTGFSTTNPNNLNSYLKAMMHKTATLPAGLGTYDVTTDCLEVLRERIDLNTGTGFSTGTDSLKAIRDAIDDLIAPAVAAAQGGAGVGFLSECISLIRKMTDEPSVEPKYLNADLIEFIESAFDQVLSAINIDSDHPILVRHDVSCVNGTQEYVLPCSVGEIWRVARIDETSRLPVWELWPSNEFTFAGYGFTIEGNIIRFGTPNITTQTLQVLYMPNNEIHIHTATAESGTTTTIEFAATPTEGTLDIRPHGYAGYMVRLLEGVGAGQERVVESYDADTLIATVRPAWITAPDDTTVYEVLPQYSRLIKHVVVCYAALDVLASEAKSTRRAEIERVLQRKMTALRNTLGKKVNRFGTRGPGVDTIDNQEIWPLVP